jgi:hypothetical protein
LADNLEKEIEFIAGEMYKRQIITRADLKTMGDKIEFHNGLGKIFFKDKFAQLNPVLGETFKAALAIWLQRNKGLPVPSISHSHHAGADAGDHDPHAHYPSLAFKIQFRKDTEIIKQPEILCRKFAECIAEIDSEKKLHWSGDDTLKPDPSHFELADWRTRQ